MLSQSIFRSFTRLCVQGGPKTSMATEFDYHIFNRPKIILHILGTFKCRLVPNTTRYLLFINVIIHFDAIQVFHAQTGLVFWPTLYVHILRTSATVQDHSPRNNGSEARAASTTASGY